MRSIIFSTLVTLAVVAQGCGPAASSSEEETGSQVHFITFGPQFSGLVRSVKKQKIAVCLTGVAESARPAWAANIQSAVLKWVAPLRGMTSDRLVEKIETVKRGQPCDLSVVASPGTHAQVSGGNVFMATSGYFASYNVLFHEFGHIFALSDTYFGGRSGQCQRGQPQSVMCNTSFSELQTDDVKGVQTIFKRTFPQDKPSPPDTRNEPIPSALFAALGQEVAEDSYEIYASSPAEGAMAYCEAPKDQCVTDEANWKPMRATRKVGAIQLFASGVAMKLASGSFMTLRQGTGATAAFKEVTFKLN